MPTDEELQVLQTLHERICNLEGAMESFGIMRFTGNIFDKYKSWVKTQTRSGIVSRGKFYGYCVVTNKGDTITLTNPQNESEILTALYEQRFILIMYGDQEHHFTTLRDAIEFTSGIVDIWKRERNQDVVTNAKNVIAERRSRNMNAYHVSSDTDTGSIQYSGGGIVRRKHLTMVSK